MMIRAAKLSDAAGIAAVHVQSWQTTYSGLLDEAYLQQLSIVQREHAWVERLREAKTEHDVIVLENEQRRIVGFISGGRNRESSFPAAQYDGEVYALYLLAHVQGQGWGRRLLDQMLQYLYQSGYISAVVWVLNGNPALQFYKHTGAIPVQEKTIRIGGKVCRETALVWESLHDVLVERGVIERQ